MQLEPIWENEYPGSDFDKKYWGEDDWERFINNQDRKVDELCRLANLFTASGLTDRDDELMDQKDAADDSKCDNDCCRWECGRPRENFDEAEEEIEMGSSEFRSLPAYCMAYDFAIQTLEALKEVSSETFESDPAFEELTANCCVAGTKIAGGHGLGYRPDSIYGNVVKCKQAAVALTTSLNALEVLSAREDFGEKATKLRQMAQAAIGATQVRIEELRADARRLQGENG